MASLNLIDWRHPSLKQEIRRYRRIFLLLILMTAMAAGIFYQNARQPIQRLHAQITEHNHSLNDFAEIETAYQTQQNRRNSERLSQKIQQQHGQALHHFVSLLQLSDSGVRIDSVSWLPTELNVVGQYQHVDAVKDLQKKLQNLVPRMSADIRFPRHKQFMIVLSTNTGS